MGDLHKHSLGKKRKKEERKKRGDSRRVREGRRERKRKIYAFICGYSRLKALQHLQGVSQMFKVGSPV